MLYTPRESMAALRLLYKDLDREISGRTGFADAFNLSRRWFAPGNLAIDQRPIVVMIENRRSRLLWKLFMSCGDIRSGLVRLGFDSPATAT